MPRHLDLADGDYQALGDFRFRLRQFLHFSEEAARSEGLEPHQHQLLLSIRSLCDPAGPTVGWLADHLLIRQHSVVGLIDRLEAKGLVERTRGGDNRRQVRVRLTAEGQRKLDRLSVAHRTELRTRGAELVETLRGIIEQLAETR